MINSNYQRLVSAFFLSSIGDWLYKLALPLFLYQKTGSPLVMAITYAITYLPFILVTPFGGVIADKLSRKQMLVRGDFASFVLTLLLAILVLIHTQNLWILYGLVFFIASVNCLYHPIFQSIIPELVDKASLAKANSYISSAENTILLLGPACSGLIIAFMGPTLAIFIDTFSFLISALLIKSIHVTIQPASTPKGITIKSICNDLKEGFVFSYKHPIVKFGCLLFIFANFGVQLILANFIFYLANNLKLLPTEIGFVYAGIGIGAIIGSIVAPTLGKHIPSGRLILLACLGQGLATGLLSVFHHWAGIAFSGALMFGCASVVIVTYFTLRQKVVPNNYLGRVVATTRLISYCAIPIASLIGGWLLKEHVSYQVLVYLGSAIMVLNALLGWITPLNQSTLSSTHVAVE